MDAGEGGGIHGVDLPQCGRASKGANAPSISGSSGFQVKWIASVGRRSEPLSHRSSGAVVRSSVIRRSGAIPHQTPTAEPRLTVLIGLEMCQKHRNFMEIGASHRVQMTADQHICTALTSSAATRLQSEFRLQHGVPVLIGKPAVHEHIAPVDAGQARAGADPTQIARRRQDDRGLDPLVFRRGIHQPQNFLRDLGNGEVAMHPRTQTVGGSVHGVLTWM